MPHSNPARRILVAFLGLALTTTIVATAAAQSNSPGTLFQWSYGASFEGGPNLDEPIVTDRPDFTEASSTVGAGVFQLESGYTYVYNDNGGGIESHSFGEPLLRVGALANWFEFRFAWNYLAESSAIGGTTTRIDGADDLYLGAKIGLTPQEGILPEMALIPQMYVPVGHDAFTANQVLPGVNWLYGWDVTDFVSTAGSTQINRRVDGMTAEPYYELAQSWTIGYTLTDRLGAYTEWFALFPSGADSDPTQHYLDGGFTYLVTDNFQLDIRAGKGLSGGADDYFLGAGASIRAW